MTEDVRTPEPLKAAWRVKYDGVCSLCGVALRTGEPAVYERPTRSIRCVECPTAVVQHRPAEPPIDLGIAGASARREHERRKANRETRVKDRFGRRLGGALLAVTDEPQSIRAWAAGAVGEEKLAKALERVEGLRILHDRRVGRRSNIDHIVIGPAGVFVIDAKKYKGIIAIRNRGWFFRPDYRLYVGRRDCSALAEGLGWQVEAVSAALVSAGVDPMPPVTPVLCFVDGEWPLFRAPDSYAGVLLEGTGSIRKLVASNQALDPAAIERLTRIIGTALPAK